MGQKLSLTATTSSLKRQCINGAESLWSGILEARCWWSGESVWLHPPVVAI